MSIEHWIVVTNLGLIVLGLAEIANNWHKDNVIARIVATLAPSRIVSRKRRGRHSKTTPVEKDHPG